MRSKDEFNNKNLGNDVATVWFKLDFNVDTRALYKHLQMFTNNVCLSNSKEKINILQKEYHSKIAK